MSTDFYLQLLDPATDLAFYHAAYHWRDGKRRVLPDRMSFESFADPAALAVGLFNGELQAVYFLHEVEPRVFQAHVTSQRGVSRETLLTGAAAVATTILTNGADEIHAWVTPRNAPLRSFLTQLGFTATESKEFSCQNDTGGHTLSDKTRNQRREFVKYVLKAGAVGPQRSQTNFNPVRDHD